MGGCLSAPQVAYGQQQYGGPGQQYGAPAVYGAPSAPPQFAAPGGPPQYQQQQFQPQQQPGPQQDYLPPTTLSPNPHGPQAGRKKAVLVRGGGGAARSHAQLLHAAQALLDQRCMQPPLRCTQPAAAATAAAKLQLRSTNTTLHQHNLRRWACRMWGPAATCAARSTTCSA